MNYAPQINQFFISKAPTPVFNIPDLSKVFGGESGFSLQTDEKGHIRALEFIALKNTVFKYIETAKTSSSHYIYKVTTNIYPKTALYIDSRFVRPTETPILSSDPILFSKEKILSNLKNLLGLPYLWGGNFSEGVNELLSFYPPKERLSHSLKDKWLLKGVDCSGILYEATNGYTPRNTNELLKLGTFLKIDGFSINQIIKIIKPLDLIIYSGHVIIIEDNKYTIESRETFGSIQTPINKRLEELFINKRPSSSSLIKSNYFVIKRWFNKKD